MKTQWLLIVAVVLLAAAPVVAEETDALSKISELRSQIGVIVTELALSDTLDEQQVDRLRESMADLYHELDALAALISDQPAAEPVEQEAAPVEEPAYNPGPWVEYSAAASKVFPLDAGFRGWSPDANLTVNLGETDQIILRIENSYYLAEWEINGGYNGHGRASASATPEGDVLVDVEDVDGHHEFLLQNGGIGPVFRRGDETTGAAEPGGDLQPDEDPVTPGAVELAEAEAEASEPAVEPEVEPGDWYSPYLDLVRAGQLESSPAMMWFIQQAQTHSYETDALRDLGEALNRMGGGQGTLEPIGTLVHYDGEQRMALPIPDPRVSPGAFTQVVNRAFSLTQRDEVYSVELNGGGG